MKDKKKRLLEQLDALKIFPKNKHVRELQKQIRAKLEKLEKKEKRSKPEKVPKHTRAAKLRKYHRYLRMIRDNLKYSDIRSQFSKRRKGKEVSIPDVIWQNPSP